MAPTYSKNDILVSRIGMGSGDVCYFKILERLGEVLSIVPLKTAYTPRGNPVPGKPDAASKGFRKTVRTDYGEESIGSIVFGNYAAGLRPYKDRKTMSPRGGRRIGAGRKKGSGKGPNSVTKSITLSKAEWARIESQCGSMSISKYLRLCAEAYENNSKKDLT
jgi:hypothetical protein